MKACLAALDQSFRELADGLAVNRPRSDTETADRLMAPSIVDAIRRQETDSNFCKRFRS
jgi:hypothetical protein